MCSQAPEPDGRASVHAAGARWTLALHLGILLYVAAMSLGWPKLLYLPVEGRWATSAPAGSVTMGYYGLLLHGLLGMVAGYGLALLPVVRRFLARPVVARSSCLSLPLLLLAALVYVAVHELGRWG